MRYRMYSTKFSCKDSGCEIDNAGKYFLYLIVK